MMVLHGDFPILSTPAGNQARREFELECDDITQAIPQLCHMGAPGELLDYTRNGVVEVCGARFHRWAGQVALGDTTVELALDKGVLTGNGRELPFVEVEVELKSGEPAVAVAYAKALAQQWNLRPESRSKYKRALMLAGKA